MSHINHLLLEGNLVKDAEYRVLKDGNCVTCFTIATCKYITKQGVPDKYISFFDIEAWYENAERAALLGKKGIGVKVVGRIHQARWIKENRSRQRVIVIAEELYFKTEFSKHETVENYQREREEFIRDYAYEYDTL